MDQDDGIGMKQGRRGELFSYPSTEQLRLSRKETQNCSVIRQKWPHALTPPHTHHLSTLEKCKCSLFLSAPAQCSESFKVSGGPGQDPFSLAPVWRLLKGAWNRVLTMAGVRSGHEDSDAVNGCGLHGEIHKPGSTMPHMWQTLQCTEIAKITENKNRLIKRLTASWGNRCLSSQHLAE